MMRRYFYPRSPCGERPYGHAFHVPFFQISIHALLAESDISREISLIRPYAFLSTLSLRRATKYLTGAEFHDPDFYPRSPCGERHPAPGPRGPDADISIHALLAESDDVGYRNAMRDAISIHALLAESDEPDPCIAGPAAISIHALLAESDLTTTLSCDTLQIFLSTLSLRRATRAQARRPAKKQKFLSTLSLRRATIFDGAGRCAVLHFYPRSPCGERLSDWTSSTKQSVHFYPRSPCGERRVNFR